MELGGNIEGLRFTGGPCSLGRESISLESLSKLMERPGLEWRLTISQPSACSPHPVSTAYYIPHDLWIPDHHGSCTLRNE